ncbi:hypothetical protein [Aeromicrobium sp. 179-A 4D2 NHS]|uniref:hypothetical protein n=1 Tax=Aeromicrobium sp. 179-A 4D2 NHS TaxID=3142375 RepID=UPI0039A30390
MQRSATHKFVLTTVAALIMAAGVMVALRFAAPATTKADTLSTTASVECDYTPDAENIAYQSEAYGVLLTAAEADTIHAGLFLDDQPHVTMNAVTTNGVQNLAFVAQHGAISIFDTTTGDALPSGIPLLSTSC